MTSWKVTLLLQQWKCWQSVGTAFVSIPLFELVEAIRGFEKSSRCGTTKDASWVEENQLDTALQEIPTKIERKQARSYRPTVGEVEGQQRKRRQGINGCHNFTRKDMSYIQAGHELEQTLRGLSGFTFRDLAKCVPCVLAQQKIRSWEFESIQIAEGLEILSRQSY